LKRIILSLFVAGSLMLPVQSSVAALKVGVVNVAKILEKAPQAAAAKNQLEKEFAPRRRSLIETQKTIRALDGKLVKDGAIMRATERSALESDLRVKNREFKRAQDELREDFNIRRNAVLGQLQKDVFVALNKFAKSNGFDLILGEGVLYANDSLDVTKKVITQLEKAAK